MGFKDGAGGRALRVDNAAMLPVKAKFQRNLCGFVGMAGLLQSLLKTANSNQKEVKAMKRAGDFFTYGFQICLGFLCTLRIKYKQQNFSGTVDGEKTGSFLAVRVVSSCVRMCRIPPLP